MTISIYAGTTTDLRWQPATEGEPARFVAAAQPADKSGPIFKIAQLDFWQAQTILDQSVSAVDRIKRGLELGLVAIDGDKDAAKRFIEHPNARMVNPLFDAILEYCSGN